VDHEGSHLIFVLCRGAAEPRPHGRPSGLGRYFAPDELEVLEHD
jgi:hypothetical protein